MFQSLKDRFLGDGVSNDRKIFNILQIISIVGLIFTILLVYIYIPNRIIFYFSVGSVILGILTLVEANRINRTDLPALFMSAFLNFIFLSMAFIYYDRIVCMVPVYFIFGLLYSILLIDGKLGLIIAFVETLFYVFLILFGLNFQTMAGNEAAPNMYDFSGVLIAVITVGILGGLVVKYRIRIQKDEKKKVDELHSQMTKEYMRKDIFMINMSHEIRTPMNAIMGTVNLLLDQNISDRVRDSSYNILNSCNALLSITNELMDISQSDRDNIVACIKYDLYDLLMEIINMMSIRLMDTSINFYIEISDNVPRYLFSDSSKIRQLIINILNNAVKYTKNGKIVLRVNAKKKDEENAILMFEVEDTGIGIKEEDIPKILSVYDQIKKVGTVSPAVKGTGLGLAICQDILSKLDGELHISSMVNVGSTFYFSFPQKADYSSMLVTLDNADEYAVLLYDSNPESREFTRKIFDVLNVHCYCPDDDDDFNSMVLLHRYTHIFIDYDCYMNCIKFLDNGIKAEKLVIISNMSQSVTINTYGSIITRPANALNVLASLTNENNSYVREIIKKGGFSCPLANILVVDDNMTNLTVASGLLKKYKAKIYTALSGKECINILENHKIDLVFLDYMMPEMNGIDTLLKIREMEEYKELPVIALTANVVNGAKEMFLQAGFDYYISKPIEVDRIERALKTYLSRNLIEINTK